MKVKRAAQRVYVGKLLTQPARYQIVHRGKVLAHIVRAGDGWRVCQPSTTSVLGRAISPIGLNGFREVRKWALKRFAANAKRRTKTQRPRSLKAKGAAA